MIINKKTGQIAYHSFTLQENGGLKFTQRDYDGKPLDRLMTGDEEYVKPSFPPYK